MGYFFAYPGDTFAAAWHAVSSAYLALFEGAILDLGSLTGDEQRPDLRADLRHPVQRDAADPRRPVGRARVPGRPVQHRRPGAAHRGAICAGYVGFAWHLPVGPAPAGRDGRRARRRRDLGRHRRVAQGAHRRARGHHDDHAQLHRALPARLPALGARLPGSRGPTRRSRIPVEATARFPHLFGSGLRGQREPARRPARRGRLLVAADALDARLPAARGRRQPVRRAHGRDERRRAATSSSC